MKGGCLMQIKAGKEGKISTEVLVQTFLDRLYEKGEINSGTYFKAVAQLKEEKDYVNQ